MSVNQSIYQKSGQFQADTEWDRPAWQYVGCRFSYSEKVKANWNAKKTAMETVTETARELHAERERETDRQTERQRVQ